MSYGITGISFIGAGVIWKTAKGVEGLTTAATLLVFLPINYFIGLGFYFIGLTSALFAYLLLVSKYKRIRRRRING